MTQTITVEQAFKKYRRNDAIFCVAIILWLSGMVWTPFLLSTDGETKWGVLIFIYLVLLIPVCGVMVLSSIVIRRNWFEWAYSCVDCVYEFERALESMGLITFRNRWLRRLAKRNPRLYDQVIDFMAEPKKYKDDPEVPAETVIIYAPAISFCWLLFGIALLLIGIIGLSRSKGDIFWLVIVFAVVHISRHIIKWIRKYPRITLGDKGIGIGTKKFFSWNNVSGEQISVWASSYWVSKHLEFQSPSGKEAVNIKNANVNIARLNHLLIVYRNRNISGK